MNATSNRWLKALSLLTHATANPRWTVRSFGRLYNDICTNRDRIPTMRVAELLPADGAISLLNLVGEDGNMTTEEIVALVGLVRVCQPRTILEIGTFNGNTTLQLAANSPDESLVFTLDLPVGSQADARTEINDEHYVTSRSRQRPRYLDSAFASKVRQVYGNSMEADFLAVCDGRRPDVVFIDGGHSYECVRSDTLRAMRALNRDGLIVWHDYIADWPGVINYLDELALEMPLFRVAGTTLVVHDSAGNRFERLRS